MRIPWYLTALGAAIAWGLHYPLLDHALKKVSLVSALLLTAMPILLVGVLFHREVAADVVSLRAMGWGERAGVLAITLTSLRQVCIAVSVDQKPECDPGKPD